MIKNIIFQVSSSLENFSTLNRKDIGDYSMMNCLKNNFSCDIRKEIAVGIERLKLKPYTEPYMSESTLHLNTLLFFNECYHLVFWSIEYKFCTNYIHFI